MTNLSVIIITKNEERNIRDCLESVKWANEIIVLDSGSTDKTIEIAREYTEKVHSTDWPGYGPQKQRALELASQEWVLTIDADERVSPALQKKIPKLIQSSNFDGYKVKRPLIFCGKLIKYANGTNYQLCLFKRKLAHFTPEIVHESIIVDGAIGKLEEPLYHLSFETVGNLLDKINLYSSLNAEKRAKQGKKSSLFKAIIHGLWMFFRVYFLKKGFLDGKEGFILAISFAEGSYYRYLKLMYLAENKNHQTNPIS